MIYSSAAYRTAGGNDYYHQTAFEEQQRNLQSRAKTGLALTAAEQARFDLKQREEAWELKKRSAVEGSKLASKFLGEWLTAMKDVKGIFGGASTFMKDAMKFITGGGTGSAPSGFDDVIVQLKNSYQDYQKNYAPAAKQFIQAGLQEQAMRTGAIGRLEQYATPDYAGVRGRAAADVSGQSELERAAMERKLLSMGIDPSSGKFGALTRKSYLDQARNTAIAMNLAARGEKERAATVTAQEASLLNPASTAGVGLNIANMGSTILGQQAALETAKVNAETAKARTIGDLATGMGTLATGYARSVMEPTAEMAGFYAAGGGGAIAAPSTAIGGGGNGMYNAAQIAAMKNWNELHPTGVQFNQVKGMASGTLGAIANPSNPGPVSGSGTPGGASGTIFNPSNPSTKSSSQDTKRMLGTIF